MDSIEEALWLFPVCWAGGGGKSIEAQRQAGQSQSEVARLSMSLQAQSTACLRTMCHEAQLHAQREGERADRERERADRERERAEEARKAYDAERASYAAFREKQLAAQASAMAVRASGSSAETGGTSRNTGTGGLLEEAGSGSALSGSYGSPVMLRSESTSRRPPPSRSHAPRGTGGCHPASSPHLLVNPRDGGVGTGRGGTREAVHSDFCRREEAERRNHQARVSQAQGEEDEKTLTVLWRRSQASRATFRLVYQDVQRSLQRQGRESAQRAEDMATALHRHHLIWYHHRQWESRQREHTVLV